MSHRESRKKSSAKSIKHGFTITELLIVVSIILVLSTLAAVFYSRFVSGDKSASAARFIQASLTGARQRAASAKSNRGFRLQRDSQFPQLITSIHSIRPIEHEDYPAGSVQIERIDVLNNATGSQGADGIPDNSYACIVRGKSGVVDWSDVQLFFDTPHKIQIPAGTGQWYQFDILSDQKYGLRSGNEVLKLTISSVNTHQAEPMPSIVAYPYSDRVTSSARIAFKSIEDQFSPPLVIPGDSVIDLDYSSDSVKFACSGIIAPEFSFSPHGQINGQSGGSGIVAFCVRGFADASLSKDPADPSCVSESFLVSISGTSGAVQVYPADLTDNNQDGKADDLFSFVRSGRGAR